MNYVPPPISQDHLFLIARSYSWAGAKFRNETIHFYSAYLSQQPSARFFINISHQIPGQQHRSTQEQEKNIHLSECYKNLAKAYEGKYDFQNAKYCLNIAINLAPFWSSNYVAFSDILVKENLLDEAIAFLISVRQSPFYVPLRITSNVTGKTMKDDSFSRTIERKIKDVKEKKQQGYVYKQRKPK